jgi:hypothetical protein
LVKVAVAAVVVMGEELVVVEVSRVAMEVTKVAVEVTPRVSPAEISQRGLATNCKFKH